MQGRWHTVRARLMDILGRAVPRFRKKYRQNFRRSTRTVHVEHNSGSGLRGSCPGIEDMFERSLEGPLRNFTNDLVIKGIEDGVFTAQLPLATVQETEITLRVRGNKVLLLTMSKMNDHTIAVPCGYIELPVFVDPKSLDLQMDPEGHDILILSGVMKGVCASRRHTTVGVGKSPESSISKRLSSTRRKLSMADPNAASKLAVPNGMTRSRSN